jgi:hypothetical protein
VFGQHSAEAAICCLGVLYVCSRGGFIIGLGGPCCRSHGSSYLLRTVSIVLEGGGEKFQFLCEGGFVTETSGSMYQESEQ